MPRPAIRTGRSSHQTSKAVPTSFYDVVVLGAHLEPLLCAALLGREGLRVLVLGQGTPEPSYSLDDVEVEPYSPVFVGVQSPVVQNVLELLALDGRQPLGFVGDAQAEVVQAVGGLVRSGSSAVSNPRSATRRSSTSLPAGLFVLISIERLL